MEAGENNALLCRNTTEEYFSSMGSCLPYIIASQQPLT
jgi:hypothetical protein